MDLHDAKAVVMACSAHMQPGTCALNPHPRTGAMQNGLLESAAYAFHIR